MVLHIDERKVADICRENGISYLALFGSHARGEERDDSDVDLLVRFDKRISLFGLIDVESSFAQSLGKKVDLVTEGSLKARIRSYVQRDLKVLYEKR